jgi:hypothetical protein
VKTQATRGQFYKNGQTKEIKDIGNFTDGYAVQKFRNVTVSGAKVQTRQVISLILIFLSSVPDAYLMYARMAVRGRW